MAERQERCETCRWWVTRIDDGMTVDQTGPEPRETGGCVRYPPTINSRCCDAILPDEPPEKELVELRHGWWPWTWGHNFCGEWTPANPEPATDDEMFAAGVLVRQQPDLLPVLENLLAEFDAYSVAVTEHGRGHEDYGGQREAARVAILRARQSSGST